MPEAQARLDRPLLCIGREWAVYMGPVLPGRPHRHQAAQLAWCPTGTVKLEGAWGTIEAPGHVLRAGVSHRILAAQPVRMLFVDPSLLLLAANASICSKPDARALTAARATALESELMTWLEKPCSRAPDERPLQMEPGRWPAVLEWLEEALEASVRVEDAAAAAGLSRSHFMHWFREASGLSFRAFVRWLRLQRAVRTLATGATLTEAAHLAGFADSAHLSRTFVATFGVPPAPLRSAHIVCTDSAHLPISCWPGALDVKDRSQQGDAAG